ncbi:acyl-CoA dehydrogenase family protein [Ensifer sp. ENS07]|uniref:acyl-CoA dehydrogenase family protein n=1 Tax=Ensifer sp. ENS07 TaxID=2769274 RepID=UPI00177DEE1F|nr:acyl-CoA dehydrogenase family protein [Ensifer sp. ENS07]MBD9641773.1 acyl-CoA dehydrogenase family protein [Ensifer sp. ENS07]
MDLSFSGDDERFRQEVRQFLSEKLPARIADMVRKRKRLTKADQEEWHGILHERGWMAGHWPKQYGGQDWSIMQCQIFDTERALAHAPWIVPFGVTMLGPMLMNFGSDRQKRHWLPRILESSDWWCQGYSEPGAGSDLASLRTKAVRDGDHFVVNGQKTWTTLGQHANMMFCLVRTSNEGRKQEGISFLLIDMNTPGVEVRPIILLDGEHEVNEVFFTDVKVPVENLVGEENKGWTYAKYLLNHERTSIAGIGVMMAWFDHLRFIARNQKKSGRPLIDDPYFAARLARVEIELENMKTSNLRALAAASDGATPVAQNSMLKIRGTELKQEITSLARRALGPYASPFLPDALNEGWNGELPGPEYAVPVSIEYFNNRKLSIFGGSNEIQREIISKTLLGG